MFQKISIFFQFLVSLFIALKIRDKFIKSLKIRFYKEGLSALCLTTIWRTRLLHQSLKVRIRLLLYFKVYRAKGALYPSYLKLYKYISNLPNIYLSRFYNSVFVLYDIFIEFLPHMDSFKCYF